MDFEIGDVVYLKSGGPPMTIMYADDKSVMCIWYESGEYVRENFHPGCLDYAEEEDSSDT